MISWDLLCSSAIVAFAVLVLLGYALRVGAGVAAGSKPAGYTAKPGLLGGHPQTPGLPGWVKALAQWALDPVVRLLIRAGISASTITAAALVLGAGSGLLLAAGHFGIAGVVFIVASLGDTLDGAVARRTHTAGPAGALFDASVDRYEEFFILSGIAMFFRSNAAVVGLVLLSLLGSFMVSYGSAKAEAFRVAVPPGWMRRAERAICVAVGTILVPLAGAVADALALPAWVQFAPVWCSLGLVAVVANVSAVHRLRAIAAAAVAAASAPSGSRGAAPGPPIEAPTEVIEAERRRLGT